MKLPHLEPLVFAKEVLELKDDSSKVKCEFKKIPSLAVFIEASAQSCASFFQDGEFRIGYLANASNIELLEEISELEYIVNLKKILSFDNFTKYSFFVTNLDATKKVVTGELTVAID
jgi:hypothetical protein